jgi:hypothetical protein
MASTARRRLLLWLGAAGVVAGVPLATRLFRGRRPSSAVPDAATALPQGTEPFPYLDIDPAALEAFEADYRRRTGRALTRGAWSERVKLQFLLSTDFFRFDADERRRISYVGYYDPAVTPCNNPLARFD